MGNVTESSRVKEGSLTPCSRGAAWLSQFLQQEAVGNVSVAIARPVVLENQFDFKAILPRERKDRGLRKTVHLHVRFVDVSAKVRLDREFILHAVGRHLKENQPRWTKRFEGGIQNGV